MSQDTDLVDRPASRERVLGSFVSLGSGEVAARLVAFLGTAYLTRRLGVDGFGVIGFATALCSYLAIGVSAGFNSVGAREVARRPDMARGIAGGAVLVRLALSVAAVAVALILSRLLPKPESVRLVVVLTSFSFVALAFDTSWVYKGLGRTHRVGMALTLSQAVYVGLLIALVRGPDDIFWVPPAQVAGELAAALVLGIPLVRAAGPAPRLAEGIRLLRDGLALTLSRLLRALIYTFDMVLLSFWLGERAVGVYAASYRLCFLLLAIGTALHVAYLPLLSRAPADRERLSALTSRALGFVWSLAAPLAVGGAVLAEPLLVTLFGADYAAGAQPLRWLLVSVALVYLHGLLHNLFLALDRLGTEMKIVALGAAVNVTLNFALIPRFGISGAAMATVAAEATILVVAAAAFARMGLRLRPPAVYRVALAAAVMGGCLLWVGDALWWPLRLGAGAGIYALALWLLQGLPGELDPRAPRG